VRQHEQPMSTRRDNRTTLSSSSWPPFATSMSARLGRRRLSRCRRAGSTAERDQGISFYVINNVYRTASAWPT
jgi:hypothetical protein